MSTFSPPIISASPSVFVLGGNTYPPIPGILTLFRFSGTNVAGPPTASGPNGEALPAGLRLDRTPSPDGTTEVWMYGTAEDYFDQIMLISCPTTTGTAVASIRIQVGQKLKLIPPTSTLITGVNPVGKTDLPAAISFKSNGPINVELAGIPSGYANFEINYSTNNAPLYSEGTISLIDVGVDASLGPQLGRFRIKVKVFRGPVDPTPDATCDVLYDTTDWVPIIPSNTAPATGQSLRVTPYLTDFTDYDIRNQVLVKTYSFIAGGPVQVHDGISLRPDAVTYTQNTPTYTEGYITMRVGTILPFIQISSAVHNGWTISQGGKMYKLPFRFRTVEETITPPVDGDVATFNMIMGPFSTITSGGTWGVTCPVNISAWGYTLQFGSVFNTKRFSSPGLSSITLSPQNSGPVFGGSSGGGAVPTGPNQQVYGFIFLPNQDVNGNVKPGRYYFALGIVDPGTFVANVERTYMDVTQGSPPWVEGQSFNALNYPNVFWDPTVDHPDAPPADWADRIPTLIAGAGVANGAGGVIVPPYDPTNGGAITLPPVSGGEGGSAGGGSGSGGVTDASYQTYDDEIVIASTGSGSGSSNPLVTTIGSAFGNFTITETKIPNADSHFVVTGPTGFLCKFWYYNAGVGNAVTEASRAAAYQNSCLTVNTKIRELGDDLREVISRNVQKQQRDVLEVIQKTHKDLQQDIHTLRVLGATRNKGIVTREGLIWNGAAQRALTITALRDSKKLEEVIKEIKTPTVPDLDKPIDIPDDEIGYDG